MFPDTTVVIKCTVSKPKGLEEGDSKPSSPLTSDPVSAAEGDMHRLQGQKR